MSHEHHSPTRFMSIVFELLSRGYVVELSATRRNSFHAVVRNSLDITVGDLQYRCPSDEQDPDAAGISYGSHTTDPQFIHDTTFEFVVRRLQ